MKNTKHNNTRIRKTNLIYHADPAAGSSTTRCESKTPLRGIFLVGLACFCLAAQTNYGAPPNRVIAGLGNPGTAIVNNNVSATFGYSFTLGSSDATLTQLGVWDESGDGLAEAHSIGLWSSGGSLLSSVVVPSGTSASLYNGFRYADVAPVSLSAGATYVLGVYDGAANTDEITFRQTTTLGNDIASIGAPLYTDGLDLGFPTSAVDGNVEGFFGPNATLSVAVPEPTTLALTTLGSLSCLFLLRRRSA
jgi:hypothetical protein